MWLTCNEFAIKHKMCVKNVYDRIKHGRVQSKKEKGKLYVWDTDSAEESTEKNVETTAENDSAYQTEMKRKLTLENDLKFEKLKNLQQDTLIKKQKQVFTKQLYRQQYAQGVYECFSESFANLKNLIIDLKLTKEKNAVFKKIFADCLKRFETALKKYLAEKDRMEEIENEDDHRK